MINSSNLRAIVHLDADAFFAAVEQRDDPKLRGRPVAVGTGVVASCSYEARRYGVTTGMRLSEARYRCTPLIVLPGAYPRYEQAARQIQAICTEQTSRVEVAALDDLYLDLTCHTDPTRTPSLLRSQILDEVRLHVSIGAGTSKLVASVATKDAKLRRQKAGLAAQGTVVPATTSIVRVPAGQEREYLAPWPVKVLHGVGSKVHTRLERLNVSLVGAVAAMPIPILRGLFGNQGRILHDRANGVDPRPVEPCKPRQSVSRSTSFDPPAADRAFLTAMLSYLVQRAVSWMRFQSLAARGLSVAIRYGDYASEEGRLTFCDPAEEEEVLREAALDRFGTLYQRRLPLRWLGVTLAPLAAAHCQARLFPDLQRERQRRLEKCKDAIRGRFGFTSLLSGSALVLAERVERDRGNFRLRTPCLTR